MNAPHINALTMALMGETSLEGGCDNVSAGGKKEDNDVVNKYVRGIKKNSRTFLKKALF